VADLRRVTLILAAISGSRGRPTLTDLASMTGLPRSSVHRLIRSLEEEGYIASVPGKPGFSSGPLLLDFGLDAHLRLLSAHRARLIDASRAVGENIELGALNRGDVVIIDRVSASGQRIGSGVGERLPLHASAFGKVLLAALPDGDPDHASLSGEPLRRLAAHTATDSDALSTELDTIRRVHVAVDLDEHQTGVCRIATVTSLSPGTNHAVALVMPAARMRDKAGLAIEALRRFNPLIDVAAAKRQYGCLAVNRRGPTPAW